MLRLSYRAKQRESLNFTAVYDYINDYSQSPYSKNNEFIFKNIENFAKKVTILKFELGTSKRCNPYHIEKEIIERLTHNSIPLITLITMKEHF